jgi:hypothetical protein
LNCKTNENKFNIDTNHSAFIENAISDFSKTKLFKNGIVFSLKTKQINDEIVLVSIIESNDNKYLYSKEKKIDENKLPSKCFELNNKLFVWWDDNHKIDKVTFDLLAKYNLLQDDENGMILLPDSSIDDNKKGVDYFFCKSDSRKFKRIISNKGFVSVPTINCK